MCRYTNSTVWRAHSRALTPRFALEARRRQVFRTVSLVIACGVSRPPMFARGSVGVEGSDPGGCRWVNSSARYKSSTIDRRMR